jgi:serine/threonine protein kinase
MEREKLTSKDKWLILTKVAIVSNFILYKDFIYRDLKSENIMIESDGYIKLIYFGFDKCIEEIGYSRDICDT